MPNKLFAFVGDNPNWHIYAHKSGLGAIEGQLNVNVDPGIIFLDGEQELVNDFLSGAQGATSVQQMVARGRDIVWQDIVDPQSQDTSLNGGLE